MTLHMPRGVAQKGGSRTVQVSKQREELDPEYSSCGGGEGQKGSIYCPFKASGS